ncbi:MAG: hypothetical protein JWP13_505 [Candidatus Saccharibacteria bacterium]|nr:hypothetical protein [Candidatus Saccharibacteria bacterium]
MADRAEDIGAAVLGIHNDLWWMGILQGVLALFFGITALFWPSLSLITLVYLFSAFVLGIGLVEITYGILSIGRRSTWWMNLLVGMIGLGVGIYLVRHPNVSFDTFILVIGLTLIARGLIDATRSFTDRTKGVNRALLAIVGIAAVVAGVIILLQPVAGGVAFVWILGLYAMVYGALTIAVALEVHNEFGRRFGDVASVGERPAPQRTASARVRG